jgi:hypothetical protein
VNVQVAQQVLQTWIIGRDDADHSALVIQGQGRIGAALHLAHQVVYLSGTLDAQGLQSGRLGHGFSFG